MIDHPLIIGQFYYVIKTAGHSSTYAKAILNVTIIP